MHNLITEPPSQMHPFEFHVSRQARNRYRFDETIFSTNGNVIFANFTAARQFAQKMNDQRDLVNFPESAVQASHINAMGLVDEMLHEIIAAYRQERNPNMGVEALEWLTNKLGSEAVEQTLLQFANTFPPVRVYRQAETAEDYLEGSTNGISHREVLLEELIMLWMANLNPAFAPYLELFDDEPLAKTTTYNEIMPLLREFFEMQPTFGSESQNLIDLLRAPALASPNSLFGQLEFIQRRWDVLLQRYMYRLLSSMDFIREEEKPSFGTGGAGPAQVIEFGYPTAAEPEAFSPDRDWMPNCVLIAKNAFVWLDQLSKKYQRAITRLDEIPDQELDDLARWGVTGLWLIGLWERSAASKTIKQMRGNPDAVASAYSLMDYAIAHDLGGESAYAGLRQKTWQRGIRLASDMVPNHMGIDSLWVIEHPDWFISLDYPPFPSYTFNGPNFSWDNRVGIYLEDHYFNNSDAAVVFKRVDFWTGSTKYIYHGNDGTSMPWNDTAQLNYLLPEVREAVIQTILNVARRFPIIRFDAAMTLAKKHYQRLWFPEPGSGGDIASRAGVGLTKEQFDAAFPIEFWREVVDRVAIEVPDTLLLAEAFWLMEGYFVRTLGMHRVYNSAFMNMMRDEKNAEYRLVIKNTLEFDPEILKRYVNFMNNPDERTAVDQFGKGDKYFGVCIVMATLPGLPMLGHGQIEGFTEKYGMEYRRAYWDEQVDDYLVGRHAREVFPLLRRRYLFAEVENFLLYDVYSPEGNVNEDIFAYSNQARGERSLVIYHNKYATARGWIRLSAAFAVKTEEGKNLQQRTLAQGLGLEDSDQVYTIFRDHVSGLEYIRSNRELNSNGLYVELGAYKTFVFINFRQVRDNEQQDYARIAQYLKGTGVPGIEDAIRELKLEPVLLPYRELVNAGMMRWLINNRQVTKTEIPPTFDAALEEFDQKYTRLLEVIQLRFTEENTGIDLDALPNIEEIAKKVSRKLVIALRFNELMPAQADRNQKMMLRALAYLGVDKGAPTYAPDLDGGDETAWGTLLGWISTHALGEVLSQHNQTQQIADTTISMLNEWLFARILANQLRDLGMNNDLAWQRVDLIRTLIAAHSLAAQSLSPAPTDVVKKSKSTKISAFEILSPWLIDVNIQHFINVNKYQGVVWFNRESFEILCWWFFYTSVIEIIAMQAADSDSKKVVEKILRLYEIIDSLLKSAAASEYRVDHLLNEAKRRG